ALPALPRSPGRHRDRRDKPTRADSPGSGRAGHIAHRHSATDRAVPARRIAVRPDIAPDPVEHDTEVPDTAAQAQGVARHRVAADAAGSADSPARRHSPVEAATAPSHLPAASTVAVREEAPPPARVPADTAPARTAADIAGAAVPSDWYGPSQMDRSGRSGAP